MFSFSPEKGLGNSRDMSTHLFYTLFHNLYDMFYHHPSLSFYQDDNFPFAMSATAVSSQNWESKDIRG